MKPWMDIGLWLGGPFPVSCHLKEVTAQTVQPDVAVEFDIHRRFEDPHGDGMILQILPHTGQIERGFNAHLFKCLSPADAGKHQESAGC